MLAQLPSPDLPIWLSNGPPFAFSLLDILRGSVYYPSCGLDGDLVKFLAGNFHSFVYVDYGIEFDQVSTALNGFTGYDIEHFELIPLERLGSDDVDSTPYDIEPFERIPRETLAIQNERPPNFCTWSIHERRSDFPLEHGPSRFSLLFIHEEGVAVFRRLYVANKISPAAIAIIQPGHGFGGNWTDFEDEDGPLSKAVMTNCAGIPQYLLYGGWGDGHFYREPCWQAFPDLVTVIHDRLRLFKSADHQ